MPVVAKLGDQDAFDCLIQVGIDLPAFVAGVIGLGLHFAVYNSELIQTAIIAVALAIGAVLIYIWLRFEWQFALGAVAALVHDVVLTIGIFAVLDIRFDLAIIAALLTIVGYSLNDTVVAFDRIRENFLNLRGIPAEEAMNISINEMLARTLITGLTTLLVLVALLVLGGESIAPFSIALIVFINDTATTEIYTASATALLLDVNPQDLIEPVKDSSLIDDLP